MAPRKLLNDCRYCDNKGRNCVRHKDVVLPEFRLGTGPPPAYGEAVAYTSTSESLIGQRVVKEEKDE